MSDRVLLSIGTKKGHFVAESGKNRKKFSLRGPFGAGVAVYTTLIDTRAAPKLYFSSCNAFFGMKLLRSNDLGQSFKETKSAPAFPEGDGRALANIWSLEPGAGKKDLLCGVEPASLFRSSDGGDSWQMVEGISNHEHARKWMPGNGGLCLHTILRDGNRVHLGISTGGHYLSEDGGETFAACNTGIGAGFTPDPYPEFGQCVHKVVNHASRPDRLFLQNHWGLYRSDDWAASWTDIADGVPSDFGFAMAIHPHDPDTVYIVPLESDQFRCVPEAKLRVYRTRDAGASWQPLGQGLPQEGAYETVLRDGLATDTAQPAGVYFGTRSGKVYASTNEGESWSLVEEGLPPVLCVKAGVIS